MTFVEVQNSRINLDNIVRYYPVNSNFNKMDTFYIYFVFAASTGASISNSFEISFQTEEERDDTLEQLDHIIGLNS